MQEPEKGYILWAATGKYIPFRRGQAAACLRLQAGQDIDLAFSQQALVNRVGLVQRLSRPADHLPNLVQAQLRVYAAQQSRLRGYKGGGHRRAAPPGVPAHRESAVDFFSGRGYIDPIPVIRKG